MFYVFGYIAVFTKLGSKSEGRGNETNVLVFDLLIAFVKIQYFEQSATFNF